MKGTTTVARYLLVFLLPGWFGHSAWAQAGRSLRVGLQVPYVDQISELAANRKVKQALQAVLDLEPETLKDHILLNEIPAPPFKEKARGEKYAQMLRSAGADSVWTDEAGNVLALRKGAGGKKTVALDAHLDTVFPEETDVKVRISGDTLKAPGIGDDTRGLAVVLAVLKAMNKAGIHTDHHLLFVATVGEEGLGDLSGVKHLFGPRGTRIDSHIAVDGVSVGTIVNGAVGSLRYRVTFRGPGGHSFGAFGLANPHNALARTIYHFTGTADAYTKTGEKTTYNIGVIGGGTSVNTIPFESWMEVDLRSENPDRLRRMDELFREAVARGLAEENGMKRMGENLTAEVAKVGDRPGGHLAENAPLVQRAAASAAHLGAVPRLTMGSTNTNLPLSLGIPSVTIGGGGKSGNAHALNEWWVNDKGHLAIQNALLILLAEAGVR